MTVAPCPRAERGQQAAWSPMLGILPGQGCSSVIIPTCCGFRAGGTAESSLPVPPHSPASPTAPIPAPGSQCPCRASQLLRAGNEWGLCGRQPESVRGWLSPTIHPPPRPGGWKALQNVWPNSVSPFASRPRAVSSVGWTGGCTWHPLGRRPCLRGGPGEKIPTPSACTEGKGSTQPSQTLESELEVRGAAERKLR